MKATPLITCVICVALAAGRVCGQVSSFLLFNYEFPEAPVFDAEGVPLGPDLRAELWGAAMPDSLLPAYDLDTGNRIIVPFHGDGFEGYSGSGQRAIVPAQFVNGGNSWLQVRAWDSRLGSTYEEVAALEIGGYGESALFFADGASPFREPPEIAAPLFGLESFSLRPVVPEPSTWALLGLGALALGWAARRRRDP